MSLMDELKTEQENRRGPGSECTACRWLREFRESNPKKFDELQLALEDHSIKAPTIAAYLEREFACPVAHKVWASHRRDKHSRRFTG